MKKLIYLCVMVAGTSFAQKNNTINISTKAYDELKTNNQLDINAIYRFEENNAVNPVKPENNQEKNALCGCMITLDNTFTLAMNPNDDFSTGFISLPFSFDFYGTTYDSVIINNNGNISFLAPYFEYTANPFPDPSYNMIAPFWGDVDTRAANGGNVWYKITSDALIVIWDHVGYYDSHDNLTNTFQLVISNGTDTIIHGNNNISFCYGDMQWTTGDASAGQGGFGGFPATTGVNFGNGVDFFQVGQFDAPGTMFDGPYANIDQVDFLDDQEVYFNVAGMNAANIPPLVMNSNICDTIDVYTGDTLHKSMSIASFDLNIMTPEFGQQLTYSISSDAPSAFQYTESGNGQDFIRLSCTFDGSGLTEGLYYVNLDASDNGVPVEAIHQSIPVRVKQNSMASITEASTDNILVYPNPSAGMLNISGLESDNLDIIISGMDGKITKLVHSDKDKLAISDIPSGMYILSIYKGSALIKREKVQVLH